MLVRSAIALATLAVSVVAVSVPARAQALNAEQARHFVAGKLFTFNCFEGSTGSGRIFHDGSVVGLVRMQGQGPIRFMRMPAGTLFVKDGGICSQVKGAFFNPCFNLTKTSANSFRGQISGFGFAYCEFTRGAGRIETAARASVMPDASGATPAAPRASIRRARKVAEQDKPGETKPAAAESKPVAAPTAPVTSAPLPAATEQPTGMRSSIPQ
jgi:hypothetical protein